MWENLINYLGLGLRVDTLAHAMVNDAETQLRALPTEPKPDRSKSSTECAAGDGAVRVFTGNAAIEAMA